MMYSMSVSDIYYDWQTITWRVTKSVSVKAPLEHMSEVASFHSGVARYPSSFPGRRY